jgi:Raf kinase inhibitor-like YbhB/YbcL family protein
MHDPDALIDFTHWIAFNIPPAVQSLPEGAAGHGMPQGSSEGTNDFGQPRYGGPCPPGSRPHHYIFHVYALDILLTLPPAADRKQLDSAISGHVLAEGEISGIYRRAKQ